MFAVFVEILIFIESFCTNFKNMLPMKKPAAMYLHNSLAPFHSTCSFHIFSREIFDHIFVILFFSQILKLQI